MQKPFSTFISTSRNKEYAKARDKGYVAVNKALWKQQGVQAEYDHDLISSVKSTNILGRVGSVKINGWEFRQLSTR